MAMSTHRILKRRGRISLTESANMALGVTYSVRNGSSSLWNGDSLVEAERRFSDAVGAGE